MKEHRLLLAASLLLAVILLLVVVAYEGPSGRETSASGFSGERARPLLRQLVGSGSVHLIGSPQNAVVRDRIVAMLRRAGYDPAIQRAFVCGSNGACATVENILARHQSAQGRRRAVLVAVHYDGVGAGPSASDDAMAVAAIVEIARLIRGERFRNDIIFLIDDGEEQGLLGARAFVDQHPWADDVGAVINLEARGTSGASFLFETNSGNAEIISVAANALGRPATNSVLYTIYKLLPNDTDFTVFRQRPWLGVNFAIIGNPERYHTPLDSYENASPASLQHHGDNALAMIRALANRELAPPSGPDAVYFDLFGRTIVYWPEPWTPVAALLALLLFGTGVIASRSASAREVLLSALAMLALAVVSAVASHFLLRFLQTLGALPTEWIAEPLPFFLAFWSVPAAALLLLGSWMKNRKFESVWSGVWLVWALAAAALSLYMPAVAYPFLVPAVGAAVMSLLLRSTTFRPLVVLLPLSLAAAMLFVFAALLYEGMGLSIMPVVAVIVAIVFSGALPAALGAPRLWGIAALGVLVVATVAGLFIPKVSAEVPAPAPITLYQDEEGNRSLLLDLDGEPTEAMIAAGFGRVRSQPYSWAPKDRPYRAAVTTAPLSPPRFQVLEFERQREKLSFRGRIVSSRGANTGGLILPTARIEDVRINGTVVPLRPTQAYWRSIRVVTLPSKGAEIEVTLKGGQAATFFAYDASPGLPPEATAVAKSRGAEYVPIGGGDRVMVAARVDVP